MSQDQQPSNQPPAGTSAPSSAAPGPQPGMPPRSGPSVPVMPTQSPDEPSSQATPPRRQRRSVAPQHGPQTVSPAGGPRQEHSAPDQLRDGPLSPASQPSAHPSEPGTAGEGKQIATLPPLPILRQHEAVSERTGVPVRPALILVAHVLLQVAVAGVVVSYGWHWYRAVFPETYPGSAHLIQWVTPEPGKWLSLTLEGALAALAALVGGACGIAGFQAWNGWKWSRWAGVAAVVLTGVLVALMNWVGLAALIPAVAGTVLLFLPASSGFFNRFARHRAKAPERYRRLDHVFYGRLPRFR